MREPVYAIIGCGNISRFHFEGLLAAGARIARVVDVDEKAAAPWAARTGALYSKDYRDALADPEVTAVSVLTSARYHREICLAALAAGKDVICEKTMANDSNEALEIRAAARAAAQAAADGAPGAIFLTAFMKRFFPATQMAVSLLPRLGRIFSGTARAYQNWGGDYFSMTDAGPYDWVLRSYGGAVVKCAGSHMLDLIMHLMGRPASLLSSVDYIPGSAFDRKATAILEYGNGATVTFETAIHRLSKIGYERNGWDEWIEINGSEGRLRLSTVTWDHPENNGALLEHYDEATGSWTEYRFPAVDPFRLEMAAFHEALRSRRDPGSPCGLGCGADAGCAVDLVIDAIGRSSKAGMRIALSF
jgi:predicted dehydrogenase